MPPPSVPPAFLSNGGEVGALMRAHDWSASPLGAPADWPQSLRSVVGLILNSKFPMFVAWGPELGFVYNDAYAEILGAKHPGALGRCFHDIWSEIWTDIAPLIERALAGESTFNENLPLTMRRKGFDEQTWFTFSYSPVLEESGKVAGMYCACTETTAHVINERNRIRENERLYNLFEQAPGVMAVLHGPNHAFELANYAFLQLAGHRHFVGKTVRDALPELADQGFYELLDQVYSSGEPFIGRSVAVKLQRHPGSALEERYVDFIYQPIKDSAGNVSGIFIEGSDVTEQYRALSELERLNLELADKVSRLQDAERRARDAARQAESERRRLDALLEATPVGIAMADVNGKLIRINPANQRLWGESLPHSQSVDEYGGWRGWWADGSQRHGQPVTAHQWALARALRGEEAPYDIIEIAPFDAPDVRRTIAMSGAPIRNDAGDIIGAVVAQVDITERMKAEAQLREADRRKDEFLAMLAHELRNPLAPISAAAELMELVDLDAKRLKQTSQVINRQVRHMTALVDDLLDVSRVTRGLVTLNKTTLDVKHVISDAIEQVRPSIEDKRHHLIIELSPETVHVEADQKRLVQILANLLNNAAKYTPAGGSIHLRMEAAAEQISLSVLDNGVGMSPELQPKVFELFSQGQRTSDRSQGGLGIGLALVKNLVELHGGSVSCFSEGTGQGSRFTVTLPRSATHTQAIGQNRKSQGLPASARKLRILLVDDNVDAAEMLGMFLQAYGHEVIIEHSSRRALERARLEQPDVCVLDIGLPDMDGNELARRLRAEPRNAAATLIAITGYGQEHDRNNSLAAGFDYHLVKPVDAAELVALLAQRHSI